VDCIKFLDFKGVIKMDAGVSSALTGGITTFQTDAMTQLAVIIPLAIVVLVTVVLVFKSLGWFKKIAGLRAK
jgi:hypothetical protein